MIIQVETIEDKMSILKESEYIHFFTKKAFDKNNKRVVIGLESNRCNNLMHIYTNPSIIEITTDVPIEKLIDKIVNDFWGEFGFNIKKENSKYFIVYKKEKLLVDIESGSTWDEYKNTRVKINKFFTSKYN